MKRNKGPADWEQRTRLRPTPRAVADLVNSHGWLAAEERWSWLERPQLQHLLKQAGRPMDPDEAPEDFEIKDLEP